MEADRVTEYERFKPTTGVTATEVVLVSVLIGLITSCLFFAYHAPGALELSLADKYEVTPQGIGLMFTVYSMPNMVCPLLAGVAIDRFGLKPVGLALLLLITSGCTIFAAAPALSGAPASSPMTIFLVGRFVLGIGGESIITFAQTASNFWFAGPYESLSMGTLLAVYQSIGSASAFLVLELVAAQTSVDFANWAVVSICVGSTALLFVYALVERAYKAYLVGTQQRSLEEYPLVVCFFAPPSARQTPEQATEPEAEGSPAGEVPSEQLDLLESIKLFPALFWLENVVIFFVVTILYTSANFFPFFLEETAALDPTEAGRVSSIIYWAVGAAPFAGALADRIGHRLDIQHLATGACLVGFLALHLRLGPPALSIGLVGLSFAFLEQNSLTLLARTFERLPGSVEGTGFGIMGIFLNTGLILIPPLVGYAAHVTGSYVTQNLIYIASLAAGLAVSLLMGALPGGRELNLIVAGEQE